MLFLFLFPPSSLPSLLPSLFLLERRREEQDARVGEGFADSEREEKKKQS